MIDEILNKKIKTSFSVPPLATVASTFASSSAFVENSYRAIVILIVTYSRTSHRYLDEIQHGTTLRLRAAQLEELRRALKFGHLGDQRRQPIRKQRPVRPKRRTQTKTQRHRRVLGVVLRRIDGAGGGGGRDALLERRELLNALLRSQRARFVARHALNRQLHAERRRHARRLRRRCAAAADTFDRQTHRHVARAQRVDRHRGRRRHRRRCGPIATSHERIDRDLHARLDLLGARQLRCELLVAIGIRHNKVAVLGSVDDQRAALARRGDDVKDELEFRLQRISAVVGLGVLEPALLRAQRFAQRVEESKVVRTRKRNRMANRAKREPQRANERERK